jgi:hypothetical protein
MAMRWFNKPKPKDIWEEPVASPIGDIEAVHRIRDICRAATDIAAKSAERGGKKQSHDAERCEQAARVAMEIAMKIGDDLLRDSAVRQIIDLCLLIDNQRASRILFRAIRSPSIREEVLRDHPLLGH